MAGTKIGGLKARDKNLAKDPDFYKKIGSIGGTNSPRPGGFNYQPKEKVIEAGRKGGKVKKRRAKK